MFVKWHDKWHDIEKCLDFRCEGTPPIYQVCLEVLDHLVCYMWYC